MNKLLIATGASLALISTAAVAAITFDPATGVGFVGKGDVQYSLGGLNNAQIQALPVSFTYSATSITEVSWVCTNTKNENTQERERTTTNSITGVVASVARVRNQITGYNLTGYVGTPTVTSSSEGPALNSCPGDPGNPRGNGGDAWTLTTPAGDAETVVSTGGLLVNGVPLISPPTTTL